MHPAGGVLDEHQDVQSPEQHGVHVQEVDREDPGGLGVQEIAARSVPTGAAPDRYPRHAESPTPVDGATVTPSFVSSPWIRRYPHSGFSLASRTTRRAMLRTVGGRPGLRLLLVSYFFAASLRCQASSVAAVTG